MEMKNHDNRAERAVAYKHKDCNCAQAVLLAFAEELGKSEKELRALGSGFGMGMGCTEATCGALCGAGMVMGLMGKSGKPTAAIMRDILHEFEEKAGATICKDLKGIETGKMLCSCDDCVRHAVRAVEQRL